MLTIIVGLIPFNAPVNTTNLDSILDIHLVYRIIYYIFSEPQINIKTVFDNMIIEGFKLMLLGMGVVFIFLLILYGVVELSARVLKGYTEKEIAFENQSRIDMASQSQKSISDDNENDTALTAIISAAISRYRNEN